MKVGDVPEFKRVYANDKRLALRPLEEASEVLEAWNAWRKASLKHSASKKRRQRELEDEIADCILACVNLASAFGIEDLSQAMRRCEARNRQRGRYN